MELNKGKNMEDWTVSECKAFCAEFRRVHGYACETKGCLLAERHICYDYVHEWDDTKTTVLTNAELEICEAVGAKYVTRDDPKHDKELTVDLWKRKPIKVYGSWENKYDMDPDYLGTIRAVYFPSVKSGGIVEVYAKEDVADGDKQDDR